MNTILIAYDLVGTDESSADYRRLTDAIKAYGTWGKVQKSLWIVRTMQSPVQVRDNLWQHMDGNDRLFCIKTTSYAAWQNAICENKWLKENL